MRTSESEPEIGAPVVVVGSVNHDLVQLVEQLPRSGETVLALDVVDTLGGKGQCQALAARSFGSPTAIVGTVGADAWGGTAREALVAAGVDVTLLATGELPTGRAFVTVDRAGENSISVYRGANGETAIGPEAERAIGAASVLLTQTEGGAETAFAAIEAAGRAGTTVVLNAAPAVPIPPEVRDRVDYLIVNRLECCQLAGIEQPEAAARALAEQYGVVMVTLGEQGGRLYRSGEDAIAVPAPPVDVVDTTGAGDNLCGVFAAAVAQGREPVEAFELGVMAGGLAATKLGCVASIPSRAEVLAGVGRAA